MSEPTEAQQKGYTAVLYFHGIGKQRRYEGLSRLIDSLDRYAFHNQETTGRLADIRGRVETPRGTCKKDVAYVSCRRIREKAYRTVRFYEAYWAPLTAGGVPSIQVI